MTDESGCPRCGGPKWSGHLSRFQHFENCLELPFPNPDRVEVSNA